MNLNWKEKQMLAKSKAKTWRKIWDLPIPYVKAIHGEIGTPKPKKKIKEANS